MTDERTPTEHPVSFTAGSPETVLPPADPEAIAALDEAMAAPEPDRRRAVAEVVARWPRLLEAWAALAELPGPVIDRYAFARVGYHRGLDALRGAGWRGTGAVPWANPENRGFLRCLAALRATAASIGEDDEADRCDLFLRQLDAEAPPLP
ncbi:MAG: DUF3151 family protein [Acidimicrobiales bacterium]